MILIVEDHADTRVAMVKLAKRAGYDAIGVGDGEQALVFLRTTRPRLIILDYHLPGVDGLEVLARVRADPRIADVPVVFYTATEPSLARERAMAAGATAYIRKGSMEWLDVLAEIQRDALPPSDRDRPSGGPVTAPKEMPQG
jgi:two-component system chemotaxis sensor kinase CheA